jgi:hypothetical protein
VLSILEIAIFYLLIFSKDFVYSWTILVYQFISFIVPFSVFLISIKVMLASQNKLGSMLFSIYEGVLILLALFLHLRLLINSPVNSLNQKYFKGGDNFNYKFVKVNFLLMPNNLLNIISVSLFIFSTSFVSKFHFLRICGFLSIVSNSLPWNCL